MNLFSHHLVSLLVLSLPLIQTVVSENIEYIVDKTKVTGTVESYNGQRLHVFKGLPFAKPPVGKLRFKAPVLQDVDEFSQIDATKEYPKCVQFSFPGMKQSQPMSEDCLYAVIWVPEKIKEVYDSTRKTFPVSVIVHGGGFSLGSSLEPYYNGTALSVDQNVISVAMNYRLGVFGFLDLNNEEAPGNMGLLDQQMALKWIEKYIQYFGGDATAVTLVGLSAGSMSVSAHLINPESHNLFRNAILDGGTILGTAFLDDPTTKETRLKNFLESVECATTNVIDCLRNKDIKEIMTAQTKTSKIFLANFRPTYGNLFFPKHPKYMISLNTKTTHKVLIGIAKDEGVMFADTKKLFLHKNEQPTSQTEKLSAAEQINSIADAYDLQPASDPSAYVETSDQSTADFLTDGLFACPVIEFANELSKTGALVYLYQFNYFGEKSILSMMVAQPHAHHSIGFIHGIGLPLINANIYNKEDQDVSKKMLSVYGSVINQDRTVVPKYDLTNMEKYDLTDRKVNIITRDGNLKIQNGHDRDAMCEKVWGLRLPKFLDREEL